MSQDRFTFLWENIVWFNNEHFPNWRKQHPVYYSNAIAGEVGELCGITKRMAGDGTNIRAHAGENPYIRLREEVVDIIIYCILLLQSQHSDVDEFFVAFSKKLDELQRGMKEDQGETRSP